MRVQGLPQALQGSQFFAIIGLAIEINNLQDEVWDFDIPNSLGPGQKINLQSIGLKTIGKTKLWMICKLFFLVT